MQSIVCRSLGMTVFVLLWSGTGVAAEFTMQAANAEYRPEVVGPFSRDAIPMDWPSTFVFESADGTQCTATAVGARTLLTAAHCFHGSSTGTIMLGTELAQVSCERHKDYPTNAWADFSLCYAESTLAAPDRGFEVINVDPAVLRVQTKLVIVGFGCRTPGGADRGFGRLSEGDAVVLNIDAQYVETGGGAAICTGDSGGGVFFSAGPRAPRLVVAVASHGDLSTRSFLVVTASDIFLEWARDWCKKYGTSLCGVTSQTTPCRV